MIYLFEDRKDRMTDYLGQELNNENIIESTFIVPADLTIEEYIVKEFSDAKAIIFHKSYRFPDSKVTITGVIDAFNKKLKDCQFVLFSGSIETGNYYLASNSQYFLNVNSAIMYSNLNFFIISIISTGIIDVRTLLFADKVQKNELLTFFNNTMLLLNSYPDTVETISYADFDDYVLTRTLKDKELQPLKKAILDRYSESSQINKMEMTIYITNLVNDYL